MKRLLCTLSLLALLGSCTTVPEGAAPATPQRPTVSSDTNTTGEGTFELEAGVEVDPGDAFASPTTFKYGADERTEVYLGLSPYNVVDRSPASDGKGFGDTVLGVRHRVWEGEGATSAAFQVNVKLPTASESEGLGSGEVDAGAAGILTQGIGERGAATLFYELGSIGRPSGGDRDLAHTLALAGGLSLGERAGLFAELSSLSRPGDTDPLAVILGATYAPNPSLVFDTGLRLGLNSDAPDAVLVIGLTTNLGPLGQ